MAALWRQSFPDDPARNEPLGMIARKLARDPELFWVACEPPADARAGSCSEAAAGAEAGSVVIGALVAGYDGVRGWLYHLAVTPVHRREGAATALVARAVDELRELGCHKVNLQVRETNREVRAFYESLGWTEDHSASLGRVIGDSP
ncbi:GNAT family N-acetyltransferase [Demequina aestuarii]|uniref:GNAT family N-acetyltransferase n=1 Tax=Demequina aestuarii TaxID=327095 RepID=UPI0007824329|nr:GNAT family N-acetyltransferase [Demequina aestuarii]